MSAWTKMSSSFLTILRIKQTSSPGVLQARGFFKGMALPLTTVSMTSSVAFGTYRNCLHCLSQARGAVGGPNTNLEVFLSGLAGGVAQVGDTNGDVPLRAVS